MGVGDTIKNAIAENTGNIEKAIIEVIDLRERDVTVKQAVRVANSRGGMGDSTSVGGMAGSVSTSTFANKGLVNDVLSDEFAGKENIQDENLKALSGGKRKLFTVQFNPSSLSLTGHSGGLVRRSDYGHGGKKKPEGQQNQQDPKNGIHGDGENELGYVPANTDIVMSVSLLFDRQDPSDAFLSDKLNFSPTGAITNVAKLGRSIAGSKKGEKRYTVQYQVEGFIAALRNRNTRIVTFHWGDFNYTGVLRSISATYTMFNPVGAPIRATVDMSILCADKEVYPNSLAVWQERYKKAFKTSFDKKNFSYVKVSQKAGSLINL